ncbi:MAG: hypothetical protein SVV03_05480 [Candidatus Nanohaloarchaea archaeon]|nr:hypothetical protein [Candidatus Nanohaloarchaea archaeon]
MHDFPEETKELALNAAKEIRGTVEDDSYSLAKGAMKYFKEQEIGYGFLEGVKEGYYLGWPHEIENQWECIEAAYYVYAVADALDLNPRMISAENWRGNNTGHELVDVEVDDSRVVIDPLNKLFGKVDYKEDRVEVEDNGLTDRTSLQCNSFEEISDELLMERMEYYRSDEGIINLLREGQKLISLDDFNMLIEYDRKQQIMAYKMVRERPFLESLYREEKHYIREGEVKEAVVEYGNHRGSDWVTLLNKQPWWRRELEIDGGEVNVKDSKKFPLSQRIYNELLREALAEEILDRKAPHPTSVEEALDEEESRPTIFETRHEPVEKLAERGLEAKNSSSEDDSSSKFNRYSKIYSHLAKKEINKPDMYDVITDEAKLKLEAQSIAEEKGICRSTVYKNMFKHLGFDEKEIEDRVKTRQKSSFVKREDIGDLRDFVFLQPLFNKFFERAYERDLIV